MTTPAGPINISIVEAESPVVSITRTPPPGVSISGTGPQGAPGTKIYQTDGQPSNSVGLAGDFAIDLATGRFYGPKTTVWPTWAQIPAITETGWHENGQAEFVDSDIYLTSAGGGFGAGTLWFGTAQASDGIDVTFELEMSGGTGADGVTFAFADASTANTFVGGGGGDLGIVGVNSVAVAFVSAPSEQVKIVTTTASAMTTVAASTADIRPNPVEVRIRYDGTKLAVWLDGGQVFNQTISIPDSVKIGFTAANGGSDDNHIIRNAQFVPSGGMLIKGEDGIPGPQGPQGIQGPAGADGADGATYPWVFNVLDYGAVGDGKMVTDGAISSGNNVLTSATAGFTSGDVGKAVMIKGASTTQQTTLVGTITGYTNSTTVTVSVNASTTVTNALVLWGTDDTTEIQAAIDAAIAYAVAHSGNAVVLIPPAPGRFYAIAGSLNTSRNGNAQLAIGPISATGRKISLSIETHGNGSAVQHWTQTVPTLSGATLVSFGVFASSSAQTTNINNNGNPAVIGGPSQPGGYGVAPGVFSNMHITLKGISILTTYSFHGLTYTAFDFSGMANAHIEDIAYGTTGTVPSGNFSSPNSFANGLSIGALMPAAGNNDNCIVRNVTVHGGYTYAFFATEHCVVETMRLLYCWSAFCAVGNYYGSVGATHAIKAQQLSVEACTNVLYIIGVGSAGIGPFVDIDQLDTESGAPAFSDNTSGNGLAAALGTIKLTGLYTVGNVSVSGPTGLKIIDGQRPYPVVTKTADYTTKVTDDTILVNATSGAVTITLHSALYTPNTFTIQKTDASANNVNIATGSGTVSLTTQGQTAKFIPSGGAWIRIQ